MGCKYRIGQRFANSETTVEVLSIRRRSHGSSSAITMRVTHANGNEQDVINSTQRLTQLIKHWGLERVQ